jgi:hypothetical protein
MKKQTLINVSITLFISLTLTYVIHYIKNNNITKYNEETFIRKPKCVSNNQYEVIKFNFKDELFIVKDKFINKYGFVDNNCKFIIQPQFSRAYNFYSGYAAVQIEEGVHIGDYVSSPAKWKFINKEGEFLEINKDKLLNTSKNEIIIQDILYQGFNNKDRFEGFAIIRVYGSGWGIVNTEGNFVVYPNYWNQVKLFNSLIDTYKDCNLNINYLESTTKYGITEECKELKEPGLFSSRHSY